MELTEKDKKEKIDIDECFSNIGYIKYEEDDNLIIYGNEYYQIHFYKKDKTYITEDKRDIVYLIINEALRQWEWSNE